VRVDFDDESVDEIGSIAEHLVDDGSTSATEPTDTAQAADEQPDADENDLVRTIVPVLDRTRLVVLSRHGMVVIDQEGNTIATDRLANPTIAAPVTSSDHCTLVGATDGEQTLWELSDGTRIETFDPGSLTGRSADGCTVTYTETAASGGEDQARFVGPDVDRTVEGELGPVAPNGASAIGRDGDGAFVLDAGSGERVDVSVDTLFAVFIDR
jgi:hypothetical protein